MVVAGCYRQYTNLTMPHPTSELEKRGIYKWESISDSFDNSNILLGNGFSINLCERLSYQSLFNHFIEHRPEKFRTLFNSFNTTNFEVILNNLNVADNVNNILGIENDEIEPVVNQLRDGLIDTIQQNHPSHSEINYHQLRSLGEELFEFQDIFTTNYDIFLYKIILESILETRTAGTAPQYQDYFYEELNATELAFNYETAYPGTRAIYYLHGSLFIYQTDRYVNYKLRRVDQGIEYIKMIGREIMNDNFPVFVAEGDYLNKQKMINSNPYLTFCLNKLQRASNNMVVYGFSFGQSDLHIANAIAKSGAEKIAISIYIGDKSLDDLENEASNLQNSIPLSGAGREVAVFDSSTLFPSLRPY